MEFADSAILLVGDEVLQGRVHDANIPTVARELSARGIPVSRAAVAPDDRRGIAEALASLRSNRRLIVTTGGLGPTEDDLTPGAVAAALGIAFREDPEALGMVRGKYSARGIECPASALAQARLPEGARPVDNPAGIAPGIVLPLADSGECIVMLPGVPREVEALAGTCLDDAGASGPGLAEVFCLKIWGIPENALMDLIKSEGLDGGASLAFLPSPGQVELSFRGPGASAGFEAVMARLGSAVFARERGPLIEKVLGEALAGRGFTLATAESCTGGLLGGRITSVPGSSEWYHGGVVCYSNDLKRRALGVRSSMLGAFGAVSAETAMEMAEGAGRLAGSDAALAVTGIAGPGGGSPEKPVGTVWIAAIAGGRREVRAFRFGGTRATVRDAACTCAMGLLLGLLAEDSD